MDDEQPVTLVASRYEEWADHYARFAAAILEVLPEAHCEHIGSTSVPDLPAKDVIDVIVGVKVSSVQNAARALKMAGFALEGMKPGHCWLAWPSRRHRESVVHVVAFEGTEWSARIAFRDLLREDPAARAEYFEAKKIAADAASGWSDYTAAKYPTVARLLTRTNRMP
ncbi:GrpB family protein [Arthrobacter sp. 1P04PC]